MYLSTPGTRMAVKTHVPFILIIQFKARPTFIRYFTRFYAIVLLGLAIEKYFFKFSYSFLIFQIHIYLYIFNIFLRL